MATLKLLLTVSLVLSFARMAHVSNDTKKELEGYGKSATKDPSEVKVTRCAMYPSPSMRAMESTSNCNSNECCYMGTCLSLTHANCQSNGGQDVVKVAPGSKVRRCDFYPSPMVRAKPIEPCNENECCVNNVCQNLESDICKGTSEWIQMEAKKVRRCNIYPSPMVRAKPIEPCNENECCVNNVCKNLESDICKGTAEWTQMEAKKVRRCNISTSPMARANPLKSCNDNECCVKTHCYSLEKDICRETPEWEKRMSLSIGNDIPLRPCGSTSWPSGEKSDNLKINPKTGCGDWECCSSNYCYSFQSTFCAIPDRILNLGN